MASSGGLCGKETPNPVLDPDTMHAFTLVINTAGAGTKSYPIDKTTVEGVKKGLICEADGKRRILVF